MMSLITEFNRNAIKITVKEKENNSRAFSGIFMEFQVLIKSNLPFLIWNLLWYGCIAQFRNRDTLNKCRMIRRHVAIFLSDVHTNYTQVSGTFITVGILINSIYDDFSRRRRMNDAKTDKTMIFFLSRSVYDHREKCTG